MDEKKKQLKKILDKTIKKQRYWKWVSFNLWFPKSLEDFRKQTLIISKTFIFRTPPPVLLWMTLKYHCEVLRFSRLYANHAKQFLHIYAPFTLNLHFHYWLQNWIFCHLLHVFGRCSWIFLAINNVCTQVLRNPVSYLSFSLKHQHELI